MSFHILAKLFLDFDFWQSSQSDPMNYFFPDNFYSLSDCRHGGCRPGRPGQRVLLLKLLILTFFV